MRTNKRVGAVIKKDNKILLVHRRKKGDEYWVLIGGGVEEGETIEEALKREVLEETSLFLKQWEFLGNVNDEHGSEHHFFFCEVEDGEPVIGGPEKERNCEENWYNLEWVEIEKLLLLPSLYPKEIKTFLK